MKKGKGGNSYGEKEAASIIHQAGHMHGAGNAAIGKRERRAMKVKQQGKGGPRRGLKN